MITKILPEPQWQDSSAEVYYARILHIEPPCSTHCYMLAQHQSIA